MKEKTGQAPRRRDPSHSERQGRNQTLGWALTIGLPVFVTLSWIHHWHGSDTSDAFAAPGNVGPEFRPTISNPTNPLEKGPERSSGSQAESSPWVPMSPRIDIVGMKATLDARTDSSCVPRWILHG